MTFFIKMDASCYSHTKQALALPSPLADLTSEFGMGSGISPPLQTHPKMYSFKLTKQYQIRIEEPIKVYKLDRIYNNLSIRREQTKQIFSLHSAYASLLLNLPALFVITKSENLIMLPKKKQNDDLVPVSSIHC